MRFEWDEGKSAKLEAERGISFEELESAIQNGGLKDVLPHPSRDKYPNQKLWIILLRRKIWVLAIEERGNAIRFVTAYQSRKLRKNYEKE